MVEDQGNRMSYESYTCKMAEKKATVLIIANRQEIDEAKIQLSLSVVARRHIYVIMCPQRPVMAQSLGHKSKQLSWNGVDKAAVVLGHVMASLNTQ